MTQNIYPEEEQHWCRGGNTGMLPSRITPSQVNVLEDGEIFVFGSNYQGAHMGGAARAAKEKYGAIWGIGEGLQGKSYAIPTMEGLDNLRPAVERFTSFARQHQELKFFVTAIGCGIAGYAPEEIAPFFLEAARMPNIYLPLSFWKIILDKYNDEQNSNHAAQKVLDLCTYMHRHGIPEWNVQTDRTILDSLDTHQQWQLGLLLGAISPTAEEPHTKALPEDLYYRILEWLNNA